MPPRNPAKSIRLHDRADLVALVAHEASAPACRRACLTGKVEVLGGFSEIPPGTWPGWILQITAKHGTVFLVTVTPNDITRTYSVGTVDEIPWHLWVGQPLARAAYSIYQGDHPAAYTVRHDVALERRTRYRYNPDELLPTPHS